MTGLSRRERRALARETKRDRKRTIKAEMKRADAERRSAYARLAGRPDSDTDHGRTSR